MGTRVHGGIITDQMVNGNLRFYKMTGPFARTVSEGTVFVGDFIVGDTGLPQPVPTSAAEVAIKTVLEKCTIVQIALISDTEIHFSVENTSNGWDETSYGAHLSSGADTAMEAAIQLVGVIPTPGTVADTPINADLGTVTVTEVDFALA